MNPWSVLALGLAWLAILVGIWLGWQLLRQNGRILLRLDELENRLNELEFGGDDEPASLPLGTEAPAFELPNLAGERKSLAQFRGQPALLIFFNPDCGFCRELMPKLMEVAAGFQPAGEGGILPPGKDGHSTGSLETLKDSAPTQANSAGLEARLNGRQGCPPPQLLILTTGDAEKNRGFFAEHKVGCPVLLQNDGEVAKAYQAHGTPTGYLVSAEGKIASELAIGAEALLALAKGKAENRKLKAEMDQPAGGNDDGRADRFSKRSLSRSRIKRDGLRAGTPAPDFRLPRLDGRGELSLSELRGKRVLLVFSSPGCGPCNTLAPELEKFHRQQLATDHALTLTLSPSEGEREVAKGVAVVMISRGEPKENQAKVKEHGLTFPVLLQQQWEISRRYAMFATPIAYLINEQGAINYEVAVGSDAILELLTQTKQMPKDTQTPPAKRIELHESVHQPALDSQGGGCVVGWSFDTTASQESVRKSRIRSLGVGHDLEGRPRFSELLQFLLGRQEGQPPAVGTEVAIAQASEHRSCLTVHDHTRLRREPQAVRETSPIRTEGEGVLHDGVGHGDFLTVQDNHVGLVITSSHVGEAPAVRAEPQLAQLGIDRPDLIVENHNAPGPTQRPAER